MQLGRHMQAIMLQWCGALAAGDLQLMHGQLCCPLRPVRSSAAATCNLQQQQQLWHTHQQDIHSQSLHIQLTGIC